MCRIAFQGALLFQRKTANNDRVTVRIPASDTHGFHLDGQPADPHHARIYVPSGYVKSSQGFSSCTFTYLKGRNEETESGVYFPLTDGGRPHEYTIQVSGQGNTQVDATPLAALPSFSTFAGAIGPPTGDNQAASLDIRGGTFTLKSSATYGWQIENLEQPKRAGPVKTSISRGVWEVGWVTGAAPDSTVTISVTEGKRGGGAKVASVTLAAPDDETAAFIGNLDSSNPASWPHRPSETLARCRGQKGKGKETCHDLDFKWLYRLYDTATVKKALSDAKLDSLPAPHLKDDSVIKIKNQPGIEASVMIDTPTCFPGGD